MDNIKDTFTYVHFNSQMTKGTQEMRWHHQLDGHEFAQTPGDSERQESLVCCSPWRLKVGHN